LPSTGKADSRKKVRVVSITETFAFSFAQNRAFREEILPPALRRVVMEAGITMGWEAIASSAADIVGIDRFGESAPGARRSPAHLGLDPKAIAARIG
jgi:transketolase